MTFAAFWLLASSSASWPRVDSRPPPSKKNPGSRGEGPEPQDFGPKVRESPDFGQATSRGVDIEGSSPSGPLSVQSGRGKKGPAQPAGIGKKGPPRPAPQINPRNQRTTKTKSTMYDPFVVRRSWGRIRGAGPGPQNGGTRDSEATVLPFNPGQPAAGGTPATASPVWSTPPFHGGNRREGRGLGPEHLDSGASGTPKAGPRQRPALEPLSPAARPQPRPPTSDFRLTLPPPTGLTHKGGPNGTVPHQAHRGDLAGPCPTHGGT